MLKPSDLAARFDSAGPAAFIYTDIERDGMMQGPNIEATTEFARNTSTPVILSGGMSTLSDVEKALPLEKEGVMGIIIGRALYEGTIDLERSREVGGKRIMLAKRIIPCLDVTGRAGGQGRQFREFT